MDDLLQEKAQGQLILIPTDADAFARKVAQFTADILTARRESKQKEQLPELITKKKAMELLGVSSSTLWRYEKEGKLISQGIKGKRYYKRSEINKAIAPLKS